MNCEDVAVSRVTKGWTEILRTNDVGAFWGRLYSVVSRHGAVRVLFERKASKNSLDDLFSDLTQDLFLRLFQKGRLRSYVESGYTDKEIEQQLYRIELPNLVSRFLRQNRPESYRIARRISDLLQTQPEFQCYNTATLSEGDTPPRCNKMVLKVFGLSSWPLDKPVKPAAGLGELTKEIAVRARDIRRTGRGSGSQIIISNSELKRLMIDLFLAMDSPADVRTMRALALSKLAVEDHSLVSIDAVLEPADDTFSGFKADFPDSRPTPLDVLLEKETHREIDGLVDELLQQMWDKVRNKTYRYRKLIEVAWHCYFNPGSPSQAQVAEDMGISCSLVSHYRRLFDSLFQNLSLSLDEFRLLNASLEKRLGELVMGFCAAEPDYRSGARRRSADKTGREPLPFYNPEHFGTPLSVFASDQARI
jgi:hypothetical protein